MEIIREAHFLTNRILGESPVSANKKYRIINNCISAEVEDGVLIVSGLSRAIVLLTKEDLAEVGDINKYEFLYKNYFLVEESFDEWKAFEKLRMSGRVPIDDLYLNNPQSFTILTTTKCNARCSYCYELFDKNKHHMTNETAQEVAEYILKACPTNLPAKIGWFGGEPLFNAKAINIITDYLRDSGKPFNCTMITNGYLFDEKLVKKAKNSWNLSSLQITIDGREDVYNKIKNYVGVAQKSSPYKKILDNISYLLKENIFVNIRINVDMNNVDEVELLVKELSEKFPNKDNLRCYVWPIFDELDNVENRDDETNTILYDRLCKIEELIVESGFVPTKYPTEDVLCNQCMADDGNSVLINVDGKLGVCEHHINDNFFATIENPGKKDFTELHQWKEYINTRSLCQECPILGDCISLASCVDFGKCTEYKKNWLHHRLILGLLDIYKKYKENKKNNN